MTNSSDQTEPVHDILFRPINGSLIRRMALRSSGSTGPSEMDAAMLKRLANSFKDLTIFCLMLLLHLQGV